MKLKLEAIVAAGVLALIASPAIAGSRISSAPLKGGPGGLVCACTNLTDKDIAVSITLRSSGGFLICAELIAAGGFVEGCTSAAQESRACEVARQDDKPVSPKQLACTLSSLDAAGSPTVAVPLDRKQQ